MNTTKRTTLSAMLLSLSLVLPFLTGQMQELGSKLLPMHIPILICGFVCGWQYGLLTGFMAPLLRCMLFSMPTPVKAIGMAFELATYGAVSGFVYQKAHRTRFRIYISLLSAMLLGRVVWGAVNMVIYGIRQSAFTWQMFLGGALLNAIPGIILQLVLIPIIILALEKSGVISKKSGFLQ